MPDSAEPAPPALRLDHAAVMTTALERATAFYTDLLGLVLRRIEDDPIRTGRRRALLCDGEGREVVELIEMPEMAHTAIPGRGGLHHLGFRLPVPAWQALRARLDASSFVGSCGSPCRSRAARFTRKHRSPGCLSPRSC